MKPKLKLFEIANDEEILKEAIEMDAGLFVNEYQHAIYYLTVVYSGYIDVYLEINDDGGPPYKDIFVKGSDLTLEKAKENAGKAFNKVAYNTNLH